MEMGEFGKNYKEAVDHVKVEPITAETIEKRHQRKPRGIKARRWAVVGAVAAIACLAVVLGVLGQHGMGSAITVYAYETGERLTGEKPVLMSGSIDDDGQMHGHPLEFYVSGEDIDSIRFSCRNEWISFADWTQKRDSFGLSKSFTVAYGADEDDYPYLVVDWLPQNLIEKLTDDEDIMISDLSQEDREDIIVMEVTYGNGESEVKAIFIALEDDGGFSVSVNDYQITSEDSFVLQADGDTEEQPEQEICEDVTEEIQESDSESGFALSDEDEGNIRLAIDDYYSSLGKTVTNCTQADPESPFMQSYEGYEPDEVVMFEVYTEGDDNKRHITIGSKDGWQNCKILNEGY
ncbi:MAG: hypothetical protein LUI02_01485 [Clostridiales bacterium]|nr:hypothetical protein [Clostridiales bacterium]